MLEGVGHVITCCKQGTYSMAGRNRRRCEVHSKVGEVPEVGGTIVKWAAIV